MKIEVEYKNHAGDINPLTFSMTRLAFAKHLGIAGQGYSPRPQKLIRVIAMYLHYSHYIQRNAFDGDHFSEPPIQLSDPTEKGQFSNLAGKAIADFLSKRIDQSIFTVNYEAAMRLKKMPVMGSRPDLLAYRHNNEVFAIEAKGYSEGCGDMAEHKAQSQQGGIPVNFSIACVSYNLYKEVRCNYHDPFNGDIQFDEWLFRELTKKYYKGLSEFLNSEFFNYKEVQIQDETFYEVELFPRFFEEFLSDDLLFYCHYYFWHKIYCHYSPTLILPVRIKEYAEAGLTSETSPFLFEEDEQNHNLYIDNDRVGLRIRQC